VRRALWLWGPVAAYAVAIFLESSVTQVPELPNGVTDKDAHGMLYAGLAILIVRALAGASWRNVTMTTGVLAILLSVAYGASDELHQRFVTGRTADLLDLAADTAGAAAAVTVVWIVARWRTRVSTRDSSSSA
jgi:VanZ family protein